MSIYIAWLTASGDGGWIWEDIAGLMVLLAPAEEWGDTSDARKQLHVYEGLTLRHSGTMFCFNVDAVARQSITLEEGQ